MRITIRYAAQKGKNRLYWWHVTRRGPISGRHIFFKSKRMPKHNIDCPSKEETGNRKQPADAIYMTYLLTSKMTKWLRDQLCLRCTRINSRRNWKQALLATPESLIQNTRNASNSPRISSFLDANLTT